jgi:hypothetical protein
MIGILHEGLLINMALSGATSVAKITPDMVNTRKLE